eukprot:TRINITY_DN1594_c1_g1_i15.p1 TRINITY_DN1594_c1_g1~~TRINITY_DN1594_c1_g1_i15.p1  ORF type:complete len:452 (+),score=88.01 TRINITY_DN1594_c1_g1_i15:1490-2845(+)
MPSTCSVIPVPPPPPPPPTPPKSTPIPTLPPPPPPPPPPTPTPTATATPAATASATPTAVPSPSPTPVTSANTTATPSPTPVATPAVETGRCPFATPYRCNDGACVPGPSSCANVDACAFGQQRCENGLCYEYGTCPSFDGCEIDLSRCANGDCVVKAELCQEGCPEGQHQCFDGTCAQPDMCPTPLFLDKPGALKFEDVGDVTKLVVYFSERPQVVLARVEIHQSIFNNPRAVTVQSIKDSDIRRVSLPPKWQVLSGVFDIQPPPGEGRTWQGRGVKFHFNLESTSRIPIKGCVAFVNGGGAWECVEDAESMGIDNEYVFGETFHFTTFAVVGKLPTPENKEFPYMWIVVGMCSAALIAGLIYAWRRKAGREPIVQDIDEDIDLPPSLQQMSPEEVLVEIGLENALTSVLNTNEVLRSMTATNMIVDINEVAATDVPPDTRSDDPMLTAA